ncbi:hypothetical protein BH10PAT3_BH10PAT3_1510 [soil metagenome]
MVTVTYNSAILNTSMNLPDSVRHYYLEHFYELPEDKQFHFVSRLGAWNQDPECLKILEDLRSTVIPNDQPMSEVLSSLINNPPGAHINAAATRQQYFDLFPKLRGIMLALFRVRHLLYVYGVDERNTLLGIISIVELRGLSHRLQANQEAARLLSTYAINCIYLIDHILFPEEGKLINVEPIFELKEKYNQTEPEDIQLLIYLYTHCIIGEANFYERAIAVERMQTFTKMLSVLEPIIEANYNNIHLDNKLEFLVCCRICHYDTPLFKRIQAECEQSISPQGSFLVDTINNFKQGLKSDFARSEHRNVIYIMSTSEYKK